MAAEGKNKGAQTWPSYLRLSEEEFATRIQEAKALLSPCRLCPRECGVDRLHGELGFCRGPAEPMVSSFNTHHGEEPPLSGWAGSGTIFFTHCNLRCVFCQNYPISHLGHGELVSAQELAGMMLQLQRRGCHNINFVTPTHFVPQILEALSLAREAGLTLPLVYNSGGYDSVETLGLLDGIFDIYLPDMKYGDDEIAKRFSSVSDYLEINQAAIREMYRQVGDLETDEDGLAVRGLIIRHLVLPEGLAGSKKVLEFIARELSRTVTVSLMSQYFPAHRAREFPELRARVSREIYYEALETMQRLGLPTHLAQYY